MATNRQPMRTAVYAAAAFLLALPGLASASSACYQDPVYDQSGTVETTTDVRIRSAACVTGTSVLFTVKRGTLLELTGRTDGWYRVKDAQGREGWVYDGMSRVVSSSAPALAASSSAPAYASTVADTRLLNQVYPMVAAKDAAWLKGLVAKIDALLPRISDPRTSFVLRELRRMAAERISALAKPTAAAAAAAVAPPVSPSVSEPVAQPPVPSLGSTWNISNVDESRVRDAWLGWYNDVRSDLGLAAYSYDARLDATALEWSQVSKSRGNITHKRDLSDASAYNYAAITKWFGDRGLVFKNVNRVTHTENIGFGYFTCPSSGDCTQEAIDGVRSIFDFYMSEKTRPSGTWGRAHYESIVKAQFRIIGLGLVRDGNTYYLTVHYGTSVQ